MTPRRARRAAVALIALVAGACTVPHPRMLDDDPEARAIDPVSRLGRWDGTRFVDVTAASLPPSTLRVLVHGWTPGWDRAEFRERHTRGWELTVADGGPTSFEPWMAELAEMITAHDPHAVVVAFSWVDDSSTMAVPLAERRALVRTQIYGEILAEALAGALEPGFYDGNGRIQMMGHSYGARVAAVAATRMVRPPDQITLFDAPDAPLAFVTGSDTDMPELLAQLPLGWGPGRVFVDNYVAMIGRRYAWRDGLGAIVDVALAPPYGALRYRPRHMYPMWFYEESPGHGFGYDWSPLTGRADPPDRGCWEQRVPGEPVLTHGCSGVP